MKKVILINFISITFLYSPIDYDNVHYQKSGNGYPLMVLLHPLKYSYFHFPKMLTDNSTNPTNAIITIPIITNVVVTFDLKAM